MEKALYDKEYMELYRLIFKNYENTIFQGKAELEELHREIEESEFELSLIEQTENLIE